jgi:competence protein ComEA
MDEEALQVRYLIVIAAVLCALMIGYNAFYVPDASMSAVTVAADSSSSSAENVFSGNASGEEYTPHAATPSGLPVGSASSLNSGIEAKSGTTAKPASTPKSSVSGKISINTATAQQISDGLDGIGEVMAKRIVTYREKNGRFKSIDEIKNVPGIGDKTFAKLKDYITV